MTFAVSSESWKVNGFRRTEGFADTHTQCTNGYPHNGLGGEKLDPREQEDIKGFKYRLYFMSPKFKMRLGMCKYQTGRMDHIWTGGSII